MPLEDVIKLPEAGPSSQNKHRWRELQMRLIKESGRAVGDFIFQNGEKLLVKFRLHKACFPSWFTETCCPRKLGID